MTLLSSFIAALLLFVPDPVETPKPESYYPLTPGNEWHYAGKVGNKDLKMVFRAAELEDIDGVKLIRLETLIDGKTAANEHLGHSDKGLFRHRFNGLKVDPPFMLVRYPINKGDTWKSNVKSGGEIAETTSTVGEETVTVPLGKFKTVKVTVAGSANGIDIKTTYWFAPDVGMVKQTLDMGEVHLVLELEKRVQGKPKEKKSQ